jgi:hypothetical protein
MLRSRAGTLKRHVARQAGQLGHCRNGWDGVRRLLADSLNHLTVPVAIAAPLAPTICDTHGDRVIAKRDATTAQRAATPPNER